MAITVIDRLYTIFGIKFDHVTAAVYLDGLLNLRLDPASRQLLLKSGGATDASMMAIIGHHPVWTGTTLAIDSFLKGVLGTSIEPKGFETSAATGLREILTAFQKTKFGEMREARADVVHQTITLHKGMVVPQTLTASPNAAARLDFRIHLASVDGIAKPMTFDNAATIDDVDTQVTKTIGKITEAFALGTVSLEGAVLDNVDDMVLEFAYAVVTKRVRTWPTMLYADSRSPAIQFRTYDPRVFATWTDAFGHKRSTASATIELDEFDATGERHATNKLTLTLFELDMGLTEFGGGRDGEASGSLILTPLRKLSESSVIGYTASA